MGAGGSVASQLIFGTEISRMPLKELVQKMQFSLIPSEREFMLDSMDSLAKRCRARLTRKKTLQLILDTSGIELLLDALRLCSLELHARAPEGLQTRTLRSGAREAAAVVRRRPSRRRYRKRSANLQSRDARRPYERDADFASTLLPLAPILGQTLEKRSLPA